MTSEFLYANIQSQGTKLENYPSKYCSNQIKGRNSEGDDDMDGLCRTGNNRERKYPRLIAHRGLSWAMPENTVASFAAAIALGADEIEFDLWATKDDQLVVCHDSSVDRTSNGSGEISSLRWVKSKI